MSEKRNENKKIKYKSNIYMNHITGQLQNTQ